MSIRKLIKEQINRQNVEKLGKYLSGKRLKFKSNTSGAVYETVVLDVWVDHYDRVQVLLDRDDSWKVAADGQRFPYNPAAFTDFIGKTMYRYMDIFNLQDYSVELQWSSRDKQNWLDRKKGL